MSKSTQNKECILCGTKFKYCPSCNQKSPADAWKNIFDDANCRTIFNLCCDFAQKAVDIKTAKEILSGCDLSKKESFRPDMKKILDEILSSSLPEETEEKPVVDPIDTATEKIAEILENSIEPVPEKPAEIKPNKSRRKRN